MEARIGCRCCQERDIIVNKKEEFEDESGHNFTSIAQHPRFASVCLVRYVLDTAYFQYRQEHGGQKIRQNQ